MTIEETDHILNEAARLSDMGRQEEADKWLIKLPMGADAANAIKKIHGVQWLIDAGFNLNDAVAKFGKAWLHD